MQCLITVLLAVVIHKLLSTSLGIYYNVLTEPFSLYYLLRDVFSFAVVYVALIYLHKALLNVQSALRAKDHSN